MHAVSHRGCGSAVGAVKCQTRGQRPIGAKGERHSGHEASLRLGQDRPADGSVQCDCANGHKPLVGAQIELPSAVCSMSALPLIAAEQRTFREVRFVPARSRLGSFAEKSPYGCQRIAAATSQSSLREFIERNFVGVEGGKLVAIFGRAFRFQLCVARQERRQSLGH